MTIIKKYLYFLSIEENFSLIEIPFVFYFTYIIFVNLYEYFFYFLINCNFIVYFFYLSVIFRLIFIILSLKILTIRDKIITFWSVDTLFKVGNVENII